MDTVDRIARTMTHELRHLTPANHTIYQSPAESAAAVISPEAHDKAPREIDANKFERRIWNSEGEKIHDF